MIWPNKKLKKEAIPRFHNFSIQRYSIIIPIKGLDTDEIVYLSLNCLSLCNQTVHIWYIHALII